MGVMRAGCTVCRLYYCFMRMEADNEIFCQEDNGVMGGRRVGAV